MENIELLEIKEKFINLYNNKRWCYDELFNDLVNTRNPNAILSVALHEYDKFGNGDRLALASSILESIGVESIPYLVALYKTRKEERGYFLGTLRHLKTRQKTLSMARDYGYRNSV